MSIIIEGVCGVERAGEIRQAILDGAAAGETALDISGVVDADLSFFQILHAALRDAGQGGAGLALDAQLPETLARRAAWCGLEHVARRPEGTHS